MGNNSDVVILDKEIGALKATIHNGLHLFENLLTMEFDNNRGLAKSNFRAGFLLLNG